MMDFMLQLPTYFPLSDIAPLLLIYMRVEVICHYRLTGCGFVGGSGCYGQASKQSPHSRVLSSRQKRLLGIPKFCLEKFVLLNTILHELTPKVILNPLTQLKRDGKLIEEKMPGVS